MESLFPFCRKWRCDSDCRIYSLYSDLWWTVMADSVRMCVDFFRICGLTCLDSFYLLGGVYFPLEYVVTRFLTLTRSIWTLRLCVFYSLIYSLDFWQRHRQFGLSGCAWLTLESTHSISDNDMIDLDSQWVCSLLSNLLTRLLTPTWSIWTLRLCVVYARIYSLDLWQWHDQFGLSGCAWFTLESTHSISDTDMVDLDSQPVRGLLSDLPTRFLTTTSSIWTLRKCVVTLESTHSISDTDMVDLDSQSVRDVFSDLLTRFLIPTWSIWTLSGCVVYSRIYSLDFWQRHGRFGLSGCAWFTLESTYPVSDNDMVDLDSQIVRGLHSNLLTQFLRHDQFGLSGCAWFTLESTHSISDTDMVDLDSQPVRGSLSNLLSQFLTMTWLIWSLSLCVVYS